LSDDFSADVLLDAPPEADLSLDAPLEADLSVEAPAEDDEPPELTPSAATVFWSS